MVTPRVLNRSFTKKAAAVDLRKDELDGSREKHVIQSRVIEPTLFVLMDFTLRNKIRLGRKEA